MPENGERSGILPTLWKEGLLGAAFLAVGFISWSAFALSIGLGFVRVEVERYAVGALYSIFYSCVIVLAVVLAAAGSAYALLRLRWPSIEKMRRAIVAARLVALVVAVTVLALFFADARQLIELPFKLNLALLLSLLALLVVEALHQDVKQDHLGNFVWRLWYAVLAVLLVPICLAGMVQVQGLELDKVDYLIGAAFGWVAAFTWAVWPPFQLPHHKPPPPPPPGRVSVWDSPAGKPFIIDKAQLLAPLTLTLLLSAAVTGVSVLPHIEADMGGAKARHAYLVLDPLDFDNETRRTLFPENASFDQGVLQTRALTVLFRNSDLFFVRVEGADSPKAESFEIPQQVVRTVLWID